ncbi:conserved hypothetical protein [Microsporum canis CBS 113480]|uniref:Uncharacterized protein n=1 Tax=Arthroderma otae (strain ATCC MYA-4605 / CBS 113480) TaxID=554155 RepID=C5FK88_ARTOC|nr:conserved hypothetical protein [Microsporum canis CBS 113480]EEQ30110.1 conserved hypothetical protein [Microsporum canis CBS 113480]
MTATTHHTTTKSRKPGTKGEGSSPRAAQAPPQGRRERCGGRLLHLCEQTGSMRQAAAVLHAMSGYGEAVCRIQDDVDLGHRSGQPGQATGPLSAHIRCEEAPASKGGKQPQNLKQEGSGTHEFIQTPTSPWSAINVTPPHSTGRTNEPAYSLPPYSSYSPLDACCYRAVPAPPKVEPANFGYSGLASPYGSPPYGSPLEPYSTAPLLGRKRSPDEEADDPEQPRAVSSDVTRYHDDNSHHQRYYSTPAFSLNQPFSTTWIGRNPRMRYLIGYYTEVIAPVIVTFDSPTNPFRLYLLELNKDNEALQPAIAALSLSNMRQRRRNWGLSTGKTVPSRRSLQAHCRMTDRAFEEAFGVTTPEEQLREESYHKGMAIRSINAQLADPVQRRTDAVFATLLMLCLFHIAGRTKGSHDSEVMKWFMRMFTWFDTMTATINDRDSQMNGCLLEVTTSGQDEWALENLAGCDPRLFRAVAQLGRLNQLSQARPVDNSTLRMEPPVPTASPPQSLVHYSSPAVPVPAVPAPLPGINDPRAEFWREWHVVRQKLESWRLPDLPATHSPVPSLSSTTSTTSTTSSSTALFSAPLPASPLSHVNPANLPEISNISESFRYSALLYLERLAHPTTPSAHPRIQTLVTAALHYIRAVQSDVFLLWPLFVVGSECTEEGDRAVIRERCCDIQRDSGFVNNLSCLQLLERIWQEEDPNGGHATQGGLLGGQAFRWRRIIDSQRLTDEYIVV